MKRSLISSCATLAAVAFVSTASHRAEAFDAGKAYEVYIFNGLQKIDTGKLIGRPFEYVDDDGHEACAYFATWASPLGVASPVQLFFNERITPGYMDCDINSTISFPTLIVNSPDYESSGVDKFQQGQSIQNMVLTEGADGSAFGVITFQDARFFYPLLIEPSADTSPTSPGESTSPDQ